MYGGAVTYFIRSNRMRDFKDPVDTDDSLEDSKVKLTDLPVLESEDWDADVDDFLGEIDDRNWDDWD